MTVTTEPGARPAPSAEPRGEGRWLRSLISAAIVATLLIIGLAGGMFLESATSDGPPAPPAADSVDVGFAQDMSAHHEQAVQMASWARDHTTDPDVKQLAYDIESTQTQQIGRMQGWLELWGAPQAAPSGLHMAWMTNQPGHDHMAGMAGTPSGPVERMPGMATTEELAQMRTLSGDALDIRFLQLMLRHHQGGVPMLQYATANASTVGVRNLASQMLTSQTAESQLMTSMLAQRGAQPLPL